MCCCCGIGKPKERSVIELKNKGQKMGSEVNESMAKQSRKTPTEGKQCADDFEIGGFVFGKVDSFVSCGEQQNPNQ